MSYWRDKVAIVTGGSRGLGLAIAAALAGSGARVAIAARGQPALEAAADKLRALGADPLAVAADVTRDADVARLVDETLARWGRLDALVNNAGASARGAALDTSPADFQAALELNFLSAVRCVRAAAPALLAARGHVVNVGSLAAKTASRYLGPYAASKFALAAYSQQLRLELGPQGLHVLLVCPGPIAGGETADRYTPEQLAKLPESARQPGAGVKLHRLDPDALARRILAACEARRPELIVPAKARALFVLAALSPRLGDWLLRRMT